MFLGIDEKYETLSSHGLDFEWSIQNLNIQILPFKTFGNGMAFGILSSYFETPLYWKLEYFMCTKMFGNQTWKC